MAEVAPPAYAEMRDQAARNPQRISPNGARPPAYEPSPTTSPTRPDSSFRPVSSSSARSSLRSRVAGGGRTGNHQYTPSGAQLRAQQMRTEADRAIGSVVAAEDFARARAQRDFSMPPPPGSKFAVVGAGSPFVLGYYKRNDKKFGGKPAFEKINTDLDAPRAQAPYIPSRIEFHKKDPRANHGSRDATAFWSINTKLAPGDHINVEYYGRPMSGIGKRDKFPTTGWGYSSTDSIGPAPRVEPLGKNDFRYPQEPSGKKLKLKVNGCSMIYTDSSGGNRGKVIDGYYEKLPSKLNGRRQYARIAMRGEPRQVLATISWGKTALSTDSSGVTKPAGAWTIYHGQRPIYFVESSKPKPDTAKAWRKYPSAPDDAEIPHGLKLRVEFY